LQMPTWAYDASCLAGPAGMTHWSSRRAEERHIWLHDGHIASAPDDIVRCTVMTDAAAGVQNCHHDIACAEVC